MHMASGGGIGHDHGATRASNVENLARGDDLADRIDNLRICTGLKKERQIFLLCCACAIREVDAVLQENLPSSKSAPSGLLFLSKS